MLEVLGGNPGDCPLVLVTQEQLVSFGEAWRLRDEGEHQLPATREVGVGYVPEEFGLEIVSPLNFDVLQPLR